MHELLVTGKNPTAGVGGEIDETPGGGLNAVGGNSLHVEHFVNPQGVEIVT